MKNSLAFLTLAIALPAMAATYTIPAGSNASTIQAMLNGATAGSSISLAAGTYDIDYPIVIPCNDLQITGPVAATPTAILAASFTGNDIFMFHGGCASLGSIAYLHFENTGAVYVGSGNNSNLAFLHNLVTNLPAISTASGGIYSTAESGVFIDGTLATTTSNVLIAYNTFGDVRSCASTFTTAVDEGGSCAGVLTHTGEINNLVINYNKFYHVEEGIHLEQLSNHNPTASVCVTCTIEYNSIWNYHRIGTEIQVGAPTDSILFEHNAVVDPINSSWGTMATSFACCNSGFASGSQGFSPALIVEDNVLVSTLPIGTSGWPPPIGVEFWGTGTIGDNNLVQGTFSNGFTWGYGAKAWQITNNHICGSYMAARDTYIENEEHTINPPAQSGNVTGATCSATPSKAPTISSTTSSGLQTVTLADSGPNTGIWYTTDGTTPTPGSGTARYYTGPLTVTGGTTGKAVGMWGAANQPTSYPANYGYIPSSVVSSGSGGGSGGGTPTKTLVSVSLRTQGAANSMTVGDSIYFTAYGVYSDGASNRLPDAMGNAVTSWVSTNHLAAPVSNAGQVTAIAAGSTTIQAMVGSVHVAPWTLTVSAATSGTALHLTVSDSQGFFLDAGNSHYGKEVLQVYQSYVSFGQDFTFTPVTGGFSICSLSVCLSDKGNQVIMSAKADVFTLINTGAIRDVTTGRYLQDPSQPANAVHVGTGSTPSIWKFSTTLH